MIITRAPLRISLAGGGTDLPAYRNEVGGLCVTAAIDRYVYFAEHSRQPPFESRTIESYWSDVPWGTGLGSSGAKHAAMAAADTANDALIAKLAKVAWQAEANEDPYAGFQDPYASVYGGVQRLDWQADSESVKATGFAPQASRDFVANLRLFYIGGRGQVSGAFLLRSACSDSPSCMARMRRVRELAVDTCALVSNPSGDVIGAYGAILNEQFALKQSMNPASTPPHIVSIRDELMKAGATGCKLVGAGGSGFLLVAAYDWAFVHREAARIGLLYMPFNIDEQGARVVNG